MNKYYYKLMCDASPIVDIVDKKIYLEDGSIAFAPDNLLKPIIIGDYYKRYYNPVTDQFEFSIVNKENFETYYIKETV